MHSISITNDSDTLSAIFKDWQVKALAVIPNGDCDPMGSVDIWRITNDHLRSDSLEKEFSEDSLSISRASVINFLSYLHGLDFIVGIEGTGKGGKRLNYTFQIDREYFNNQVSSMLLGAIINEYPDVDHFKMLRLLYETRAH